MAAPILRPYQVDAISRLRGEIRRGRKRIVLVAPTGSGKTVIASAMIHAAVEKGSRCLFLAHRRELIDQSIEKLDSWGVSAGVIMAADKRRDDFLSVQVASVQTLVRRLDRKTPANLIIVDECHHSTSETYKKILNAYPEAVVIGLTATPWRSDKVGLSDLYQSSVLATTPAELMQIGALVEADYFAFDAPDLHQIKMTAGDFNQKDLGIACNTKVLVGSVVREYNERYAGRSAIVFPVNIEHSRALVRELLAAGFSAEHIDCDTPTEFRKTTMERFRSGALQILSSVGVLTEGFDAPRAEICILARPTKSLSLHLQMIGRALRLFPGKTRAVICDHAGNIFRHGFADDDRDYSLTATPERVRAMNTCPACHAVFSATKKGHCPNCNELIAVPEERGSSGSIFDHKVVDGTRITREQIEAIRGKRTASGIKRELTDRQLERAIKASRQEQAAELLRLRAVAESKGFQPGFVGHQFRETFSKWPKFTDEELVGIEPAKRPFFPLPPRSNNAEQSSRPHGDQSGEGDMGKGLSSRSREDTNRNQLPLLP